jgi:flagellar transcriptional activator FlhD
LSKPSETQEEIREINFSYLLLAQRLLLEDKVRGMRCLGVSERVADVLAALTPAQAVKLASSVHLLCRFRFDAHAILSSLAEPAQPACAKPGAAAAAAT